MAGETIAREGVNLPRIEHSFGRMEAASKEQLHAPRGLIVQIDSTDWRATVNGTRTCSVVTCDRAVKVRGMCLMHYKRARTAANPSSRFSLMTFDDHLNHDGPVPTHRPDLGKCWTWTGATNDAGYGIAPKVAFGTRLAHRIALVLALGREVDGVCMHECDNPPCCRPSHLREDTQAENMADAAAKGRTHGGRYDQTHCIHGHELTAENVNVYLRPDGYTERKCRACRALQNKELAATRKLARHGRGLLRNRKEAA